MLFFYTPISVSLGRHWDSYEGTIKVVEFYIRGTTSNETFDYTFYKEIPPIGNQKLYAINNISSFDENSVILNYYRDVSVFDFVGVFFSIVALTVIVGIVFSLLMMAIGKTMELEVTWLNKYLRGNKE